MQEWYFALHQLLAGRCFVASNLFTSSKKKPCGAGGKERERYKENRLYLQSMKALQKEAIREALAPGEHFSKLIVGPPGTGKTAVSTAIIEYCFVEKIPLFLICGQNQGLDVIAHRWSSVDGQMHSDMAGVYRFGTEFTESVDSHFRDDRDFRVPQEPTL